MLSRIAPTLDLELASQREIRAFHGAGRAAPSQVCSDRIPRVLKRDAEVAR